MSQPPSPFPAPDKRRRHLMDPNAPRPVRDASRQQESLTRVQQWVMSALAVTTIGHLCVGLILAAVLPDDLERSARIGLSAIAAGFGVMAILAFRAIHGLRLVSPWLLLGLLPGAIGLWLVLG